MDIRKNDENGEETFEDRVRRYARNRYEMRMHHKWRLQDTAEDDWRAARALVEKEFYQNPASA